MDPKWRRSTYIYSTVYVFLRCSRHSGSSFGDSQSNMYSWIAKLSIYRNSRKRRHTPATWRDPQAKRGERWKIWDRNSNSERQLFVRNRTRGTVKNVVPEELWKKGGYMQNEWFGEMAWEQFERDGTGYHGENMPSGMKNGERSYCAERGETRIERTGRSNGKKNNWERWN